MRKLLVIGDTHFQNAYPSFDYLGKQFNCIEKIIKDESPKHVVFLGDIFHFRKPDPETVVRVYSFFQGLNLSVPGLTSISIIRGNHDTASKSDEQTLSILEILDNQDTSGKIYVLKNADSFYYGDNIVAYFIPHYDDENKILEQLKFAIPEPHNRPNVLVFGHFGYKGCINPNGDEDCPLSLDVFKYPTFLGHIHKAQDEGNVHVVGTPYSTSFSEADYKHRYAVIDLDTYTYEFKPINHGVRYLQFDLDSLGANKEFIVNSAYTTILRVYLSHLLEHNSVDLRKKIMEEYNVAYVDIKYLPLMNEDTGKSSYNPKNMVFEITDQLINKYLDEVKSEIPRDKLLHGLSQLKNDTQQN